MKRLRRWAAERAFALACWLEPRSTPVLGAHVLGRMQPPSDIRCRCTLAPGSTLYRVRLPPPMVLPTAPAAAAMLRAIACDVELGVVRGFSVAWPDDKGRPTGALRFSPTVGSA